MNKSNEFKALSKDEANKKLNELAQFRYEITEIRKNTAKGWK